MQLNNNNVDELETTLEENTQLKSIGRPSGRRALPRIVSTNSIENGINGKPQSPTFSPKIPPHSETELQTINL